MRLQRNMRQTLAVLLISMALSACANQQPCNLPLEHVWVDQAQVKNDVTILSSDSMQGRKTNQVGAQLARDYLNRRYQEIGLTVWSIPSSTPELEHTSNTTSNSRYNHPFDYPHQFSTRQGINVVGVSLAKHPSKRWRIVTAHYDHLGKRGSRIYNGADDNASGVAGLLAIAQHWPLTRMSEQVNLLLVATDAEENGLHGGYAIVEALQEFAAQQQAQIELAVNLDMIGTSPRAQRIYIEGDNNLTEFEQFKDARYQQSQLCIRNSRSMFKKGQLNRTDWLRASDHYPFHKADIPWVYYGVPPHKHYHQTTDTADIISWSFLSATIETAMATLQIKAADIVAPSS
ncbi:M28 family peptidase [Shewanella maritima]|uniref:M28 family peptidase n=1 Tax=Shewanella maritima TaxID=2520507 RepID=UPI003735534C